MSVKTRRSLRGGGAVVKVWEMDSLAGGRFADYHGPMVTISHLTLLGSLSGGASAEEYLETVGDVVLSVTDMPVQGRCTTTKSSGDYQADQKACEVALLNHPVESLGLPEKTILFPGRDRTYANGSCLTGSFEPLAKIFDTACKAALARMGKARVTDAISPSSWVSTRDYKGSSGSVKVKIGVGSSGRATYCVTIKPGGDASTDGAVCRDVLKNAVFEPALDSMGLRTPSVYSRSWQFQ